MKRGAERSPAAKALCAIGERDFAAPLRFRRNDGGGDICVADRMEFKDFLL